MKIRAILETETMDPDFREPFLDGMPIDITEASFDRIVRYASGCTDVQQSDVIATVIQHAEEIEYYLNFLEKPETLYTFTENIISLFKSFIK